MKIISEVIHELIGHGSFVLLFGGRIENLKISLLWPYEFSYIDWDFPTIITPESMIWVHAGGILACLLISFLSIVLLIFKKQVNWRLSIALFWLAFWCWINGTGYLIIGGISPFGDILQLINLEVLTPFLAIFFGIILFLLGFYFLSDILREILIFFIEDEGKWGVFLFWVVIIPIILILTLIGRGMFELYLVSIGFFPGLFSYLIEFQIKEKRL